MKRKLFTLAMASVLGTGIVSAASARDTGSDADAAARFERMWNHLSERVDANKDQAIDVGEARAVAEQRFKRLDKDGDGTVTEAEFLAAPSKGKKEGAKAERRQEWRQRAFAKLDPEKTGAVTQAAYIEHSEKRFLKMDADGDGKVTKEELKSRLEEHKKKRQSN